MARLPKTRSGKILRGTIKKIADGEPWTMPATIEDPKVLDEIGSVPPKDIGFDLLPRLVGRARAVLVEGYFRDIGTADAYRLAREEWPARANR